MNEEVSVSNPDSHRDGAGVRLGAGLEKGIWMGERDDEVVVTGTQP